MLLPSGKSTTQLISAQLSTGAAIHMDRICRLNELLAHIMNKTEVTKSVNRNNAEHCILFEAVNLIMKQGE